MGVIRCCALDEVVCLIEGFEGEAEGFQNSSWLSAFADMNFSTDLGST